MEDGLRETAFADRNAHREGLNPCCYGRWSQSGVSDDQKNFCAVVLILVVMEDGLRDPDKTVIVQETCLNPCCYGRWSQRAKNAM